MDSFSRVFLRSPARRHLLLSLPVLAAPAWAADAAPRPLRIVASFSVLADLVRQVAPPDAEVSALVGPDADAHAYAPTPADARRLASADLVVVNGLGFEGWLDRLVRASGYRGPVVVATQGLTPRRSGAAAADSGHDHGHDHGAADPHAWQDLAHARRYVATVAEAIARLRPEVAATVRARVTAYTARLDALDAQVRARLGAVPAAQRRVVSSHDAFGYFSAAYGVQFLSPRAWNTDREPSAAAVARLIGQIRQQKLRAVFIENITDARLMERIAAESGAKIGGRLYSDALSAPGGPADTYLRLFAHNAWALADTLGAPPAPLPAP